MAAQHFEVSHPCAADLRAFAIGKLPQLRAAIIEEHLDVCERCATTVADSPPDDFVRRLYASARAIEPSDVPTRLAPVDVSGLATLLRDHPRFRLLRPLAEGGFGQVYLAEHRILQVSVALKTIKPQRVDDRSANERFLQEAKVAAQLDHPAIARVLDAEQLDGIVLIALEYVPGKTLAQIVAKKGPLPAEHACHFIRQVALGLEHASQRGVIHRDIKPQNIMIVAPAGAVKILDFGLGRLVDDCRQRSRLTRDDVVLGTPHYIAPEQIENSKTADSRADIYSLGCTFYFLLAGTPPFTGSNAIEILNRHAAELPLPISLLRNDVPPVVAELIERMLAKDPANRPQSAAEIATALKPFATAYREDGDAIENLGSSTGPHSMHRGESPGPLPARFAMLRSPIVLMPVASVVLSVLYLWMFR